MRSGYLTSADDDRDAVVLCSEGNGVKSRISTEPSVRQHCPSAMCQPKAISNRPTLLK